MRTINSKFAKVVLDASKEAFLVYIKEKKDFKEKIKKIFSTEFYSSRKIKYNQGFTLGYDIGTKEFDEVSYGIFLVGLAYIKDKKTIIKITQKIGRVIFKYFQKNNKFLLTGDPDDKKSWQSDLDKLMKCLINVGYLEDGKIVWKGEKEFLYQMKDPVILSSATKLFNEYGIAQHYSSRTIEAFFRTYKIIAKEKSDFSPNKYNKDLVIEHWSITKF